MSITSSLEIKATIDEFELINSGIINLFSKQFKLHINDLTLSISFETNKSDSEAKMIGNVIDDKNLSVSFINLNNALLEGFFTPIEFGTLYGRKLYLSFSAWTLDVNNNIRSMVYNVFLGKVV